MSDYINRDIAIARLTALEVQNPIATMSDAKRVLADMPAADAVKVVRCKDCAKRHTAECLMEYECVCGAQYSWESDDEFCSGGARKTDD